VDADNDPILAVGIEAVLLAFIACEGFTPNLSMEERYKAQKEKALDLLHWAFDESDLGKELLKAKAQAAYNRRDGSGDIRIGPLK
jgi:hypothetical protein